MRLGFVFLTMVCSAFALPPSLFQRLTGNHSNLSQAVGIPRSCFIQSAFGVTRRAASLRTCPLTWSLCILAKLATGFETRSWELIPLSCVAPGSRECWLVTELQAKNSTSPFSSLWLGSADGIRLPLSFFFSDQLACYLEQSFSLQKKIFHL